jgi:hypothetical protein
MDDNFRRIILLIYSLWMKISSRCKWMANIIHPFFLSSIQGVVSGTLGSYFPFHDFILLLKLSIKSPCRHSVFGHAFTPVSFFSSIHKQGKFIKSRYEMLKFSIKCTRFKSNYSNYTVRSSENICSGSGRAQAKGKTWWNSVYCQNWWKT